MITLGFIRMLNKRMPAVKQHALQSAAGGLTSWAEAKWSAVLEETVSVYDVDPKEKSYTKGVHPEGSVRRRAGSNHRAVDYTVDFSRKSCSCKRWSDEGVPCGHARALWEVLFTDTGMPRTYFHDFCFADRQHSMFTDGTNNTVDTTDLFFIKIPDPDTYAGTPAEYAMCVPRLEASDQTQTSRRIRSTGELSGNAVSANHLKTNKRVSCPFCGTPLFKKSLKEHQETTKCKKEKERREAAGELPRRMGLTGSTTISDSPARNTRSNNSSSNSDSGGGGGGIISYRFYTIISYDVPFNSHWYTENINIIPLYSCGVEIHHFIVEHTI